MRLFQLTFNNKAKSYILTRHGSSKMSVYICRRNSINDLYITYLFPYSYTRYRLFI